MLLRNKKSYLTIAAIAIVFLIAFVVKIYAANTSPSLSVSEPNGVGDNFNSGRFYDITYTLNDADDIVTVKFYYDTDNIGLNGVAIAGSCAVAPEGTDMICAWDTTGIPIGSYYVYGITSDGVNPSVSAYSGLITLKNCVGGINLTTTPSSFMMNSGDSANFNSMLVSSFTCDDIIDVVLDTSGLPPAVAANLFWFNQTSITVPVLAGQTVPVPFKIALPYNTPTGIKAFRDKAYSHTFDSFVSMDTPTINITLVNANVMGFAWSENIGWISFNSLNCDSDNDGKSEGVLADGGIDGCPALDTIIQPYGVNLDFNPVSPTYNQLSGYAWSENIGWVSFNETVGCPSGTCQPKLVGTDFSGWARALSNGGGWDGWIKLREDIPPVGTPSYGVSINGADFRGFAWGSDVIGWLCFNNLTPGCDMVPAGPDYKVYLTNTLPSATNLSITSPTITALCTSGAAYGFQWIFSDSGDMESQFQIQIDNDSNFLTPTVNRTFSGLNNADGSVNTQSVLLTPTVDAPGADKLSYNITYFWRVQVWDSTGASSGWIFPTNVSLTTPIHMYPTADFICSPSTTSCPSNHAQFEPISFTDKSICYDNNNNPTPCASRSWSFGDGSPLSTLPNPKHTYTAQGNFFLGFTTTDPSGFICTKNSNINIGVVSPKWKEVIPK